MLSRKVHHVGFSHNKQNKKERRERPFGVNGGIQEWLDCKKWRKHIRYDLCFSACPAISPFTYKNEYQSATHSFLPEKVRFSAEFGSFSAIFPTFSSGPAFFGRAVLSQRRDSPASMMVDQKAVIPTDSAGYGTAGCPPGCLCQSRRGRPGRRTRCLQWSRGQFDRPYARHALRTPI